MKKLIGIVTAILMLLSVLPAGALAEGAVPAEESSVRDVTTLASWDFETDPIGEGWQFIDGDGDGHNWERINNNYYSNSGDYSIASASYADGALSPDNWAVLPQIEIPTEGYTALVFYGAIQSELYTDIYRVYVGTGDDLESMEPISDDMVLPGTEYAEQVFDLSAYAGQTVRIAIRHYNCSNEWRIYFDDFSVVCSVDDDPYAIHEVSVDGWGTPVAGVAGIDHMFLTTPDGAPYYIIYGGWRDETDQQQMWSEEHVFIPGHIYTEGCQIWAEEGYYFAEDCVFYGDGGTDNLDLQWCRVDENDNWICYMNSIEMVCEAVTDIPGDIDFDSDVDTADAIMVLRYIMGIIELSDAQLANAEVDGDGSVSIIDSLLVLRMALGLIEEFPAGN